MKIKLDEGAILPYRAHPNDAGMDLFSREDAVVPAYGRHFFDTGVHVDIPPGYFGLVASRSGLNKNHGLTSTGIIDTGYSGSIGVILINNSSEDYVVSKREKISQLIVLPCMLPDLEVVDSLPGSDRGEKGFGSTGKS